MTLNQQAAWADERFVGGRLRQIRIAVEKVCPKHCSIPISIILPGDRWGRLALRGLPHPDFHLECWPGGHRIRVADVLSKKPCRSRFFVSFSSIALVQDAHSDVEIETSEYRKTAEMNSQSLSAAEGKSSASGAAQANPFPRIAGFKILSVASRGGNGTEYRPFDQKLNRLVALKLMDRGHSWDPVRSYLLRREAQESAAVKHVKTVPVYQVVEIFDAPFIVMEFIQRGSLAERLQKGTLPVTEAVELGEQVASAIASAHEKSLVHRDLKPDNIQLDIGRTPHVCDIGPAYGKLDGHRNVAKNAFRSSGIASRRNMV